MSKILAAAGLAAAMLAGTSVASYATVVEPILPGKLSFTGNLPTNGQTITVGSTSYKYDLFAFVPPILGSDTLDAQVGTSTFGVTFKAFDFFTKTLTGYQVFGSQGIVGTSLGGLSGGFLSFRDFTPGTTYYVGVSATGPNKSTYAGTLAVKAVPLPTSVALFGTAIAGLGLLGAARRKKSSSVAI